MSTALHFSVVPWNEDSKARTLIQLCEDAPNIAFDNESIKWIASSENTTM